jgi:uncharacterized protein YndB with AHSA1/START domain
LVVVNDYSNQMVVKGSTPMPIEIHDQPATVRREVEIDATPEEVWESLASEDGRERWLEDDPDRRIEIEVADEPERLVWWWWSGDSTPSRVEFRVLAAPAGTRVIVTETAPSFPMMSFTSSWTLVAV